MAARCPRLKRVIAPTSPPLSLFCQRRIHSCSSVLAQIRTEGSLQPTTPTTPIQSQRPKVQEYLAYVAEHSQLTLQDLESLRPESHSPLGSSEYEAQYEAVFEKLDRSFTSQQLRNFITLYGYHAPSRHTKRKLAAIIMEKQWGWPSLSKSQKLARERKEIVSRVFPLQSHQAFLLLGNDGSDILSLSQTHKVHMKFSRNPLNLTITGSTPSVTKLEEHIETLKNEIQSEVFKPPSAVELSGSVQKLSRASGCFLETVEDGTVRLWYRQSMNETLKKAKRLISRFVLEARKSPLAVQISHEKILSPSKYQPLYALYPFLNEPFPQSKGRFRVRRVGRWFEEGESMVADVEDKLHIEDTYIPLEGNYKSVREQLLDQSLFSEPHSTLCVTATPGHVVLTSAEERSFTLIPPLDAQKSITTVIEQIRAQNYDTEFIESSPMAFWQAPDLEQGWKRRLIYETVPKSDLQIQSIIFQYPKFGMEGDALSLETSQEPWMKFLEKEATLSYGTTSRADLLMPDYARDLRLSASAGNSIPNSQWPTELLNLVEREMSSRTHQDAPLSMSFKGCTFTLKEDYYLQSKSFPIEDGNEAVQVVSERRFDSQIKETYMTYQVACYQMDDFAWQSFWNKCEEITRDDSGHARFTKL